MGAPEPGRRERKKIALRAAIKTHCAELIEAQGVEGATVEAICDAVDISKKTFYNYFASKDALIVELCQSHLLADIGANIETVTTTGGSCAEQLDLIFSGMFGGQLAVELDLIFSGMFDGQLAASRFDLALIDYLVSNFASNRGACWCWAPGPSAANWPRPSPVLAPR